MLSLRVKLDNFEKKRETRAAVDKLKSSENRHRLTQRWNCLYFYRKQCLTPCTMASDYFAIPHPPPPSPSLFSSYTDLLRALDSILVTKMTPNRGSGAHVYNNWRRYQNIKRMAPSAPPKKTITLSDVFQSMESFVSLTSLFEYKCFTMVC